MARGCGLHFRSGTQRDDKNEQEPAGSPGLHNGIHPRPGSGGEGLATYIAFVVYRMFQKSSRRKIKKISAEGIINCYKANEDLMEGL